MKKMFMLMLVLGIASLAGAAMNLQISVSGNTALTQTTIMPSDWLSLGITNTGDFVQPEESGAFALVCNPTYGVITQGSGVVTGLAPSASSFDNDPANWGDLAEMFGNPGVYGTLASWTTGTFAGGEYFNQIAFHCNAQGDAIVQLIWSYDFVTYSVVDTLTVHQIPEPATMLLLSLGGLALRRFKK